jgi:pimeloyl-ACP methyl ester carboxylesterase
MSGGASVAPPALAKTAETAWLTFRLGPRPGVLNPGSKFPIEAADQFFDEVVPDLNNWFDGDQNAPTIAAVQKLLDRIGPAVLVVHSQSSKMGWRIAEGRPGGLKALIQIEGVCTPDPASFRTVWRATPLLSVWGDYITPDLWGEMFAQCASAVSALRAAGAPASLLKLSDVGLPGHDHMLMLDHDNLLIADRLIAWLDGAVK